MRALITVISLLAVSHARAETPLALAPRDGVLLLRNGEVLSGRITHAGDQYYVSLKYGEIQVKATEVDMTAASLSDIYDRKRAALRPGIDGHLELADWCLRERLLDSTETEVRDAKAIDARHPRVAYLERRLAIARQPSEAHATSLAPAAGPTNEDLDRFVRGMPSGAVETFTSTIQPLLINNCTTSGCHGPRSSGKLRLTRLPLSGPTGRRLTQRNLYSVWQTIDASDFAGSPLLTRPVERHGTAKAAIFSSRDTAQYRQLVAWVREATRRRKGARPAMVSGPTVALSPAPSATVAPLPSVGVSDGATGPAETDLALPDDVAGEAGPAIAAADGPKKQPRRPRDKNYQPVDAFDAEVFNRRYFPD
jgi:hypothetical protein